MQIRLQDTPFQAADQLFPGLGATCTNFLFNNGPGIINRFLKLNHLLNFLSTTSWPQNNHLDKQDQFSFKGSNCHTFMGSLFTNVEIKSKIWQTSALHWFGSFQTIYALLLRISKSRELRVLGVILWLENCGRGIFLTNVMYDFLILVKDAQMVTPFFNIFLYMQIHSDFPTHESKKEKLDICSLFKNMWFLSSPALWTRTWTLQRSALASLFAPKKCSGISKWCELDWIHLTNKYFFQHLNCTGFTLFPEQWCSLVWAAHIQIHKCGNTNTLTWEYKRKSRPKALSSGDGQK